MEEYNIKSGQISYSSGTQYHRCPKAYDYKYNQKLNRIKAREPTDPLLLGTTLHLGMELDYEAAESFYLNEFYVMDDNQVNELIKIEHWVTRGHEYLLELDVMFKEYEIDTPEYKGTIDLVTDNNDGTVDLWDYKYCADSSIERYLHAEQLHLYKYFFEKVSGLKVRDIRYIIFPKLFIRQMDDEDLSSFRNRIKDSLNNMHYKIIRMDYIPEMLALFSKKVKPISMMSSLFMIRF